MLLDVALKLAGVTKEHVVNVNVFLKDIENDYIGMNEVYDKWIIHGKPPCRTTVGAKLADPSWLVEFQVVAVLNKQ